MQLNMYKIHVLWGELNVLYLHLACQIIHDVASCLL
jgi:hypothetical protein